MTDSRVASNHWQAMPLPWQRSVFERIQHQAAASRLPHALLITGISGIGKEWLAEAITAGLLCSQPNGLQACGRCASCLRAQAGSHGDMRWLEVPADKRQIGIDQVRAGIDFLAHTAAYGNRKVLVIAAADRMTVSSANALLKTLEEPSSDSQLILVASQPWLLPATVRSRCQTVALTAPDLDVQRDWLHDAGVAPADLDALLELSGGRPMAALALTDAERLNSERQVSGVWQGLLEGSARATDVSDELRGVDLVDGLESLQRLLEKGLRELNAGALTTRGRTMFRLLRIVSALLARLRSGANPSRDIALDNVALAVEALGSDQRADETVDAFAAALGIGVARR